MKSNEIRRYLLLIFSAILFALMVSACGGGGGGSGTIVDDSNDTETNTDTARTAYTIEEENEFSNEYTEMAYDYYNAVVNFNKVVFFDIDSTLTDAQNMANFLSNLDTAIAALEAAEDSYDDVVAVNATRIEPTAEMLAGRADYGTDTARKLLNLYDSGLGPERLTMDYIADKTGKSVKYLKAMLQTIKNEAEAQDWADHADRMDDAAKRCEVVRDGAVAANTAIAAFAGVPAIAGTVANIANASNTVHKVFLGAKAVYQVYSTVKAVENVTTKGARVVMTVGNEDVPPAIPNFSDEFLDKHPVLKSCDTVVSLVTGIKDIATGDMYSRVALIGDYTVKGLGNFYQGNESTSYQVNFTDSNKEVKSLDAINTAIDDNIRVKFANTAASALAAQVDSGSFTKLTYIDDAGASIVENSPTPSLEFVNDLPDGEIVQYDGTNDVLKVSDDYYLETDGEDDTASTGAQVSVDATEVSVDVPESDNFSVSNIYDEMISYAASFPTAVENLPAGAFDGTYSCTEAGVCGFTIKSSWIDGWVKFDVANPTLQFRGDIDLDTGYFVVAGSEGGDYFIDGTSYPTGVLYQIKGYVDLNDMQIESTSITLCDPAVGCTNADQFINSYSLGDVAITN